MVSKLLLAVFAAIVWAEDLYDNPHTLPTRQTMVQLFEWKWADVARECEDFLQYYGYGAVEVSPAAEHIWLSQNNDMPWWVRYQPVSYKIQSRSGSRSDFINMVNRCNKVNVSIIVDVVFNHMVGVGQKKGQPNIGSFGDSDFDGTAGAESFPGVGYTSEHFNDYRCNGNINGGDYQNDASRVRNCRLVGLLDLNQGHEYVRQMIVGYLNDLIDIGVAGFRFDASKHMWPGDLAIILSRVKDLRSDIFGSNQRPFATHEVTDRGGEIVRCDEYVSIGRYSDFNYGAIVAEAVWKKRDFSDMRYFGKGYGYGNLESHDVLAFIDNHDNQREPNLYVPIYKAGDQHAVAVGFMLAWEYGFPRVMSSFFFNYADQGPPSFGPNSGFQTKSPQFDPRFKTCVDSSGFVCEHRWFAIRGMARFRQEVSGTLIDNVIYEQNRLAFGRGGKGFFALNNGDTYWKLPAQTGMPAGAYCEVWSGELRNGACSDLIVNVQQDGKATFVIPPGQFMAIHTGWKL